jgi:hypothetical protein
MSTQVKTPSREPAATSYNTAALYQCPSDGSVKHATICHAYARNYSTSIVSLTIASPGTGTPGTSEEETNEYYKETLTANNGDILSKLIGKKLLPGEFVNEKSSAADSVIIELSVVEELNS